MDPIVNESNRLLYQAFVCISNQYAAIGEEYRAKALDKSSQVIANYPEQIIRTKQLVGFPGIGIGSIRRINEFLSTGQIKLEYNILPKRTKFNEQPVLAKPRVIDVLVPSGTKYNKVIIPKSEYKYMTESEYNYVFSNVL